MLVPSNRLFYAIEAVLFIAYNGKSGAVASRDVAERQNLPARYLEPMLQKLVRAGILKSVRGPQGGYILGRERRRISLADIARALGKEAAIDSSTVLGEMILLPLIGELQQEWNGRLESITLADLCTRASDAGITSDYDAHHDFTI